MPRRHAQRPTVFELRRARRMAYLNGAIWSFGNGLVSTMLVIYLAMDLGVEVVGLGVGLIIAAPQIVGLLRMSAPTLIGRLGDRKSFCLATFALAGLVLTTLPAAVAVLPTQRASLYALVAVWCVFHLLQYLGTVALWSWLADLAPLPIRGRFIGRRERSMVAAQAAAMILTAIFSYYAGRDQLDWPKWLCYTLPTILGAFFMLAAIIPLALMPRVGPPQARAPLAACLPARSRTAPRTPADKPPLALLAPFLDRRFLGLMLFGCWFSFFNGVTQSAHFVYGDKVLLVSLSAMLTLRTVTRVGQFTLSPICGRLADRLGDVAVLAPCLFLVAQGPLFYLLATPAHPWLIDCAWIVWIAYAGVNVALPNLMLRLSPRKTNASYIAAYYALTGLFYAGSTIVGGCLVDMPRSQIFQYFQTATGLDHYQTIFLVGWLARMAAVPILLLLVAVPGKIKL